LLLGSRGERSADRDAKVAQRPQHRVHTFHPQVAVQQ
jgi:hypothetical protein